MSYHRSFIAKLQKQGHWLVSPSADSITLTKRFGKKVVSVILYKEVSGHYTLAPIDYAFRSTVSHFDYAGEEHRWARNKGFIKSLIRSLKALDMWEFIKNKDTFISVNTNNKKSDKTRVKNELHCLI